MGLQNWCEAGLIHEHETNEVEIHKLLQKADKDIDQCSLERMSADWKFIIAYTAALACANAALAAAGYRTAQDKSPHENAIGSLQFTILLEDKKVKRLQSFRRKRHAAHYEIAGSVSDAVADEMYKLACELRSQVEDWIAKNYPGLIGE